MGFLIVQDAFIIRGRVVVTGRVGDGVIRAGDRMTMDVDGVRHRVSVHRIELGLCVRGAKPDGARAGENAGLMLDGAEQFNPELLIAAVLRHADDE